MPAPLLPALDRALSAHEADPTSRAGAHLADHSFRFDVHAPTWPVPRPRPGEPWTLAQTLQEVRIRNAAVVRTSRGLRVRHAHLMADLARSVEAHADAVGLWLDLGRPEPAHGWDDETALRLGWLRERLGSPQTPVALRPGVAVVDWPAFVGSVEGRYAQGPAAPCADGLRRDLEDLFAAQARLDAPAVVGHVPARAA